MEKATYKSPIGDILIEANERGICRVQFVETRHAPSSLQVLTHKQTPQYISPAIERTIKWLDIYFGGGVPDFVPQLAIECTEFRRKVYEELLKVKQGETVSYGELAKRISPRMSAQAIGGAMKNNHVALIVPCHRVIGANGKMTGYAAGVWRKKWLLKFEVNKNDGRL